MLTDHWPPSGLRLTTPRLELRLPTEDELAQLADVAERGVHPPERMPFVYPWTDDEPLRAHSVLQYHWRQRAAWQIGRWCLTLAVFEQGRPVGFQDIAAEDFAILGQVSTGSWLGLAHQGRGIGTEMRAAVLHLAFAGIGARAALSSAALDNPASLRVSAKLGYEPDGTESFVVRGQPAVHQRLRLTRERWETDRRTDIRIEGLEPCLEMLDADLVF